MPDGENRENQEAQQPGPKITEPDPNYDPNVGYLGEHTSEQTQESMFRESAKRLAAEEEEIVRLGLEYTRVYPKPLDYKYFNVIPGNNNTALLITADAEDIGMSQGFKHFVSLEHRTFPSRLNIERRLGINIDTDTHLAIHPNRLGEGKEAVTFYWFDDEGNHAKANSLYGSVFLSEMTPEDFELAGSVLDGIKSKLMTALGRTPPGPQSSNQ